MSLARVAPVLTVDEIVESLRDHVWTLIRAQKVDAAMVLLAASVEDYLRAVAEVPVPSAEPALMLEGRVLTKMDMFQPLVDDDPTTQIPVMAS